MKIKRKLVLGFGVSALLVALVGGLGVYESQVISSTSARVIDVDMKLVEHAQRMRANLNMMRRYEKDLFFSLGDPARIEKYQRSWQDALAHAKLRMEALGRIESEPEDQKKLAAISRNLEAYASGCESVFTQVRAGAFKAPGDANKAMEGFKASSHQAEEDITAYAQKNDEDIARVRKELEDRGRLSRATISIIAVGAFLGMGLFGWLLVRTIRRPLEDIEALVLDMGQGEGDLSRTLSYKGDDELGAICAGFNRFVEKLRSTISQVAQTAEQVASATQELSATAEQINQTTIELSSSSERQRVAMTQSSSALEQMAASIREVRSVAGAAEGVAAGSLDISAQGSASAEESNQAMDAIRESSGRVNRITGVIADIARQTNLLSLNAAIEAAKAGAQGKGFAVVAEEIRKLAERSAGAAKEISALIEESGDRVEAGVSSVGSVGRSLSAIEASIRENSNRIRSISLAMEEQAQASHEMVSAVGTTAQITEQSASAATELSSTIHEVTRTIDALAQVASSLRDQTMRFKLA